MLKNVPSKCACHITQYFSQQAQHYVESLIFLYGTSTSLRSTFDSWDRIIINWGPWIDSKCLDRGNDGWIRPSTECWVPQETFNFQTRLLPVPITGRTIILQGGGGLKERDPHRSTHGTKHAQPRTNNSKQQLALTDTRLGTTCPDLNFLPPPPWSPMVRP